MSGRAKRLTLVGACQSEKQELEIGRVALRQRLYRGKMTADPITGIVGCCASPQSARLQRCRGA
jgi:hypothetical protein